VAYPDGIELSWADGRGASVPDREGIDDVGFLGAPVVGAASYTGTAPIGAFLAWMHRFGGGAGLNCVVGVEPVGGCG
jgi:polyhydroxybutyrate depolymerase